MPLLLIQAEWIAGVDEAGRGPLAGPVVAAAVILNPSQPILGLDDSKKISSKKRLALFDEICEKAYCYAIAEASVAEIDTFNILQASLLAMKRAIERLKHQPQYVLIDGLFCPKITIPAEAIIKGDSKIPAISAASILAKVYRDRLMLNLHTLHPEYGFNTHSGYGTQRHLAALDRFGPCPHHRCTFSPVRSRIHT